MFSTTHVEIDAISKLKITTCLALNKGSGNLGFNGFKQKMVNWCFFSLLSINKHNYTFIFLSLLAVL